MSDLLSQEQVIEQKPDPTQEQQSQPSSFDWASSGIPEDIYKDPSMKSIKDVQSLAKSYVHAQRMIGKDKVIIPGKNSTKEEWNNFYSKLGHPSDVKEYQVSLKEGQKFPDSFLEGFKQFAHNNYIMPNQASEILSYFEDVAKKQEEMIEIEAKKKIEDGINGLKKEWGQAFPEKIQLAKAAVSKFVDENSYKYLEELGLTNDPNIVKIFANIGESLGEKPTRGDGPGRIGMTPNEASQELNSIMANHEGAYYNNTHPDHKRVVERVSELMKFKR